MKNSSILTDWLPQTTLNVSILWNEVPFLNITRCSNTLVMKLYFLSINEKRAINIPGENLKVTAQSNLNVNFFLTTYKMTSFETPNLPQLILQEFQEWCISYEGENIYFFFCCFCSWNHWKRGNSQMKVSHIASCIFSETVCCRVSFHRVLYHFHRKVVKFLFENTNYLQKHQSAISTTDQKNLLWKSCFYQWKTH